MTNLHDAQVSRAIIKFESLNVFLKRRDIIKLSLIVLFISLVATKGITQVPAGQQIKPVPSLEVGKDGRMSYEADELGNRIPDFSYSGYKASEQAIPNVAVRVVVPAKEGDATLRIQAALDYVASLPPDKDGFRGVVLLGKGVHSIEGRLEINTSGVVLRGCGMGTEGTILIATGLDRRTLISVAGINDKKISKEVLITDAYVPVNAFRFNVAGPSGLKVGDHVFVHRPSTSEWIYKLGCDQFGGQTEYLGWKPGERDIYWDTEITKIDGSSINTKTPLTASLDAKYGGGDITTYLWPGRLYNVGIENLTLESAFDKSNVKDENHCWSAISMENVMDAWVRQVQFRHFAGSAVALFETVKQVTVEDCISAEPVSEIGGQRRNTFFTMGQQTLFLRCYAENGYHDFATGFCAAGPNAFVQCESVLPYSFSGSIDSWATGVLFDIVNIDGQALSLVDLGQGGLGAGWCAANSMLWQCSASWIKCFNPPTANNFAYGTWGQFAGNGIWIESNSQIRPRSLFYAQLADRLGKNAEDFSAQILPYSYDETTTSPSVELAQKLSKDAFMAPLLLRDFILNANKSTQIPLDSGVAISDSKLTVKKESSKTEIIPVKIKDGWLVADSKVLTGKRFNVRYWSGNARPFAAAKAEPALTRNVPGREGNGYADNLQQVVDQMVRENIASIDHNYGLWYDRRRDDHERIRRMDGDVSAPFYELPFARSGQEIAWDGLSKYDLTKFNPWYWDRLKQFAILAEEKGKILIHQNYFQHNIIEAGAHWADFPWRPANNINNTGFPEPPAYAGEKRMYMAEQFYDVNNILRKELHRNYIRKCLDNFADQSNVIQSISAEYTGPLDFMKFWLDVIVGWENETGKDVLVSLCATKDVQDSILADAKRVSIVDIIDIRYWFYREDSSAYAPLSGQNLAPRQHARLVNPGKTSFNQVYRAVHEYRSKFPGKAVTYSSDSDDPYCWAVFMAGGSLPALPVITTPGFLESASGMQILEGPDNGFYLLQNKTGESICYLRKGVSARLDLKSFKGRFRMVRINPDNGSVIGMPQTVNGGKELTLDNSTGDIVFWLVRN
jgi:hypothetical protein